MAAQDAPDQYVFRRAGEGAASPSEVAAAWFKVLRGKALQAHTLGRVLTASRSIVARWEGRKSTGLKPGLSRGGKAMDDVGN